MPRNEGGPSRALPNITAQEDEMDDANRAGTPGKQARVVSVERAKGPAGFAYLGRQPVLDRHGHVVAYELLQRLDPLEQAGNDDQTTMALTSKVLLEFGFDRLVGGGKAYVKAPLGFIQQAIYRFLPNTRTVLEVGNEDSAQDLLPGVREARAAGYAVAIDHFRGQPELEPLLPEVDVVKIDTTGLTAQRVRTIVTQLRWYPGRIIVAEKVETREQHQFLRGLPVDLFQGYYFARPALLSTERIPVHTLVLLELAGALQDTDLDLQKVARLVAAEPRVSYRLLRLVNSASLGLSHRIDSIERAVTMLGAEQVRRFVLLLTLATSESDTSEIVNLAAIRARMGELLAPQYGVDPAAAFTVGLLSLLDAALGTSIRVLVEHMPLTETVRAALVDRQGPLGVLLAHVITYERGTVHAASPASPDDFVNSYVNALSWLGKLQGDLVGG